MTVELFSLVTYFSYESTWTNNSDGLFQSEMYWCCYVSLCLPCYHSLWIFSETSQSVKFTMLSFCLDLWNKPISEVHHAIILFGSLKQANQWSLPCYHSVWISETSQSVKFTMLSFCLDLWNKPIGEVYHATILFPKKYTIAAWWCIMQYIQNSIHTKFHVSLHCQDKILFWNSMILTPSDVGIHVIFRGDLVKIYWFTNVF